MSLLYNNESRFNGLKVTYLESLVYLGASYQKESFFVYAMHWSHFTLLIWPPKKTTTTLVLVFLGLSLPNRMFYIIIILGTWGHWESESTSLGFTLYSECPSVCLSVRPHLWHPFSFVSTIWCSRPYKPYIFWKLIICWWQWPRRRLTKKTKTHRQRQKLKCLRDPMYAIFFKSRGFKDLNYYIGCPLVMRKTRTKLKFGSLLFFALFPCRHNSLKEEIKTCF